MQPAAIRCVKLEGSIDLRGENILNEFKNGPAVAAFARFAAQSRATWTRASALQRIGTWNLFRSNHPLQRFRGINSAFPKNLPCALGENRFLIFLAVRSSNFHLRSVASRAHELGDPFHAALASLLLGWLLFGQTASTPAPRLAVEQVNLTSS